MTGTFKFLIKSNSALWSGGGQLILGGVACPFADSRAHGARQKLTPEPLLQHDRSKGGDGSRTDHR